MLYPKIYIGPMSKNIVDALLESGVNVGLIPSRRQIDWDNGYVNKWTTEEFVKYVRKPNILLERDHGGPNQGTNPDNGKDSLILDCSCFDIIHIDPWKVARTFDEGRQLTADYINFCHRINPNIFFEVGTEEAIFHYEPEALEILLRYLYLKVPSQAYQNIVYAVIQSGTSLKENRNTGNYDQERLKRFIAVCNEFGVLSKEHNGDYLPNAVIKSKFDNGLTAINIAPEFGQLETKVYVEECRRLKLFDIFYDICYKSGKWVKWVDEKFDPASNKEALVNICGHYVLSQTNFLTEIKQNMRPDIDFVIRDRITQRLVELSKL